MFLTHGQAFAQFTQQINYQGKLTDNTGATVTDGDYEITYRLYDAETGGSLLFTEVATSTLTSGLFSYMVGSSTSLSSVDFNQPLYLSIEVNGDGEMTPRKRLGAVPAAFVADDANTVGGVASTSVLRSDVDDSASGLLTFTGGLISSASSTITNLSTTYATTTNFIINNELFTDLTGSGLENTGGALTANISEANLNITGGPTDDYVLVASSTAAGGFVWSATSSLGYNDHDSVTLNTGAADYLSLSGQEITLGLIDLASDITGTLADGNISDSLTIDSGGTVDPQAITLTTGYTLIGDESNNAIATSSLFVASDGKIGVGTTTPTASLSVVNQTPSVNMVYFYQGDSGAVASPNSNNVVIEGGTNTGLSILAPDGSDGRIDLGSATDESGAGILWNANDALMTIGTTYSAGGAELAFRTNNNQERMRIDSGGNVGIGTTSPASLLDVWGDLQVGTSSTPVLFADTSSARVGIGTSLPASALNISRGVGSLTTGLSFGDGDTGIYEESDDTLRITFPSGGWRWTSDSVRSVNNAGVRLQRTSTEDATDPIFSRVGDSDTGIYYTDTDNEFGLTNGGVSTIFLDDTNFVGIGTTSPASKLDVWGDFQVGTSSIPTLFTDASTGYVGINTSTPTDLLDIAPSSENTGITMWETDGSDEAVRILANSNQGYIDVYVNGSVHHRLSNSAIFNQTGAATADFTILGDTDSELFEVDASADTVGISTSTPGYTFTVDGDVMATGALYDNNYNAGTNGMVLQTTGTGFVWVATSSLGFGSGNGSVSSVDMSVPTGLAINGNPITTSGTLALTYDTGYAAVLTASTTNWNTFYDTPSTQITAGTGLSWSSNTLNAEVQSSDLASFGSDNQIPFINSGGSDFDYSSLFTFDGTTFLANATTSIGTTTATDARLSVQSTGTSDILNLFETDGERVLRISEGGTVNVGSGGTPVMQINNSNGRFSLNDPSGDFRFEAVGSSGNGYFALSSAESANGDIFVVNGSGDVGIGTSSPSALLTVGDGVPSVINGTDDLYVTDDVEVSGTVYANTFFGLSNTIWRSNANVQVDLDNDANGSNQFIIRADGSSQVFTINESGQVTTGIWQGTEVDDAYISDTLTIGSGSTIANDIITPDMASSTGQTDEYCLTYESTGDTWEWQDCSGGSINLTDLSDVDTMNVAAGNILFYNGTSWATTSTSTLLTESEISTSAQLATLLSDESGSGLGVFNDGASLINTTLSTTTWVGDQTMSGAVRLIGDEVRIGSVSGATYTDGDGDLYVRDELEVDGNIHFNSSDLFEFGNDASSNQFIVEANNPRFNIFDGTNDTGSFRLGDDSSSGRYHQILGGLNFTTASQNYLMFEVGRGTGIDAVIPLGVFADNRVVASGTLEVRATSTNDILRLYETGGSEIFTVLESGNVGVGTTTPSYNFSVAGDVYATGGIVDSSGSLGASGYVLQTDGTNFTWVATSTLGLNGTAESNALESTITGIADTEILIGNGDDSGTFVAISGDATLANNGTLTLASSNSNLTTLSNVTAVGALNVGSITSGFGNIDIGSSNLDADGTITFGGLTNGALIVDGSGVVSAVATTSWDTTLSVGADNQIPFTNSGGTDFDYSSNFTFDGSTLSLQTTGTSDILNLFETSGTEVFTVLESGNVGIGTSTPAAELDVYASSGVNFNITGGTQATIEIHEVDATADSGRWIMRASGDEFVFQGLNDTGSGGGDTVKLTRSGNALLGMSFLDNAVVQNFISNSGDSYFTSGSVGIGTTSPASTFDVWGDLRIGTSSSPTLFVDASTGQLVVGTSSPQSTLPEVVVAQKTDSSGLRVYGFDDRDDVSVSMRVSSGGIGQITASGNLELGSLGGSDDLRKIYLTTSTIELNGGSGDFDVIIEGDNDASLLHADAALDRIGISSSSPTHLFSVAGDTYITGALYDNNNTAGTNGMVLQSTGSGFNWVATSTLGFSNASLTIGSDNQIPFSNSGSTDFDYSSNFTYDGSTLSVQTTGSNDILNLFETGGTEVFTVLESGNVGIGTTTPSHLFSVAGDTYIGGTLRATGAVQFDSLTDGVLAVDANGNLTASTTIGANLIEDSYVLNTGDTMSGDLTLSGATALLFTGEGASIPANGGIFRGNDGQDVANALLFTNQTSFNFIMDANTNDSLSSFAIHNEATSSNPLFIVTDEGFIGVGTATPQALFTIGSTTPSIVDGLDDLYVQDDIEIGGSLFTSASSTIGGILTVPALHGPEDSNLPLRADANVVIDLDNDDDDSSNLLIRDGADATVLTLTEAGQLSLNGDTNTYLSRPAADEWAFTVAGSEALRIDSNGLVGIGTTTPNESLVLTADSGDVGLLILADPDDSTESDNPFIQLSQDGNLIRAQIGLAGADGVAPNGAVYTDVFSNALLIGTENVSEVQFGTNDVVRMTIGETGNVGIGTTSPASTLDVWGGFRAGTSSIPAFFVSSSSNYTGLATDNPIERLDISNGVIRMGNNVTPTAEGDNAAYFGKVDNQAFVSHTGGFAVRDNGTVRLIVDTDGNVGIGTTTPKEKLHISGTGEQILITPVPFANSQDEAFLTVSAQNYDGTATNWGTEGFQFRLKTDDSGVPRITIDTPTGGEAFTVLNGGNVGIGTTTPSQILDIYDNNAVINLDGDSRSQITFRERDQVVDERVMRLFTNDGDLTFQALTDAGSGSGDTVVIERSSGNSLASFYTNNNGSTVNRLAISDGDTYFNAGNVGIGTTTPDRQLVVLGNTTQTIGSSMMSLGSDGSAAFLDLGIEESAPTDTPFIQARSSSNSARNLLLQPYGGDIGIGTTSPSALLSWDVGGMSSAGVFGYNRYATTSNSTENAAQFAGQGYFDISANTATTTFVGDILRVEDGTTYGNTVRGFEVQANRGGNTQGENTALSGFARTFGVRGYSSGDAGGSFEPAGGFFETGGTTQGNAIRGYSSSITTSELLSLFQDTSEFTGTGLLMNFGNAGGTFPATSTAKFVDLQQAGTSMFTVEASGTTTIGDGTTNNQAGLQIGYGGLCVDNDGSCTASTTGRISSVSSYTGNSDLAEMYFSSEELVPGDIVVTDGFLSVTKATGAAGEQVLGVVSTKPGLLLGADDTSLIEGQQGYPLALSGRVPIRLSDENGPIAVGDPLTLSSIPGVAMKAKESTEIVGYALEAFEGDRAYSDGFINQFGDDIAEPDYSTISTTEDIRAQDGCFYGGGTAAGEEEGECVNENEILDAMEENVAKQEAQAQARYDAEQAALESLRRQSADVVRVGSTTVNIGQVIMFVDRGFHQIASQTDTLNELTTTNSTIVLGQIGDETLWSRLKVIAQNFVNGVLTVAGIRTEIVESDKVDTSELCVDDVCVTAEDLRALLNSVHDDDNHADSSDSTTTEQPETTDNTVSEPVDSTEEPAEDGHDESTETTEAEDVSISTSTPQTSSSTEPVATSTESEIDVDVAELPTDPSSAELSEEVVEESAADTDSASNQVAAIDEVIEEEDQVESVSEVAADAAVSDDVEVQEVETEAVDEITVSEVISG